MQRYILGTTFWLTGTLGACQTLPKVQEEASHHLPATLLALKSIPRPDEFARPAEVATLLVSLRDQIRNTLEASLAKAPASATVDRLKVQLQGDLGGQPEPGDDGCLGDRPRVDVQRPKGHPGILLVTADYPTFCGRTTSLYVFRVDQGVWRLSWVRETSDHPDKDPGQENLEVVLSDSLPDGSFFLASCHNPPWCTSCWSVLRLVIARFDVGGRFLGTAVKREMTFYRCDETNLPHLEFARGGFVVRYLAMSSDPGLWGRRVLFRFRTGSRGLVMEPMPGLLPDETVDVWMNMDSGTALLWTEEASASVLKPIQEHLHKLAAGTYLYLRRAKGERGKVLVAFEPDDQAGKGKAKVVWYITLTKRKGIYRVVRASERLPEGFGEEQPPRNRESGKVD